jgi:hypothetical protein
MRPKTIDIDVANASLTGFASNVTGAAFTITTNATTDGLAHQVSILNDSATDHSAKTVTLVGTDANGKALTEVVTGPNTSATVESAGYFKTLTSATPSATIGADTFDIGWVDEVASQIIPLNWRSSEAANISVDVTGTINFTVQETFVDIQTQTPVWVDITALASKTADTTSVATVGATAVRIIVNSYSSGAELQVYMSQADC